MSHAFLLPALAPIAADESFSASDSRSDSEDGDHQSHHSRQLLHTPHEHRAKPSKTQRKPPPPPLPPSPASDFRNAAQQQQRQHHRQRFATNPNQASSDPAAYAHHHPSNDTQFVQSSQNATASTAKPVRRRSPARQNHHQQSANYGTIPALQHTTAAATTTTTSGTGDSLRSQRSNETPQWVSSLLGSPNSRSWLSNNQSPSSSLFGTASIVYVMNRIADGSIDPVLVSKSGGLTPIVKLFYDTRTFPEISDKIPLIGALHALARDPESLSTLLAAGALDALSNLVMSSSRFTYPTSKNNPRGPSVDSHKAAHERVGTSAPTAISCLVTKLPAAVWDAVIRTMCKMIICSPESCSRAIQGDSLSIIAAAALPGEPITIRVRAAAGLASVANWSGPRYAIEIIETPNVVASMTAVLTDVDDQIPGHVRRATLDGLTAMAHRSQARTLLKQLGCDQVISHAARRASRSGDLAIAARSTVAAGHLSGHSMDEFGFLVASETSSDPGNDDSSGDLRVARVGGQKDERSSLKRATTGLAMIQSDVLNEKAISVQETGRTSRTGPAELVIGRNAMPFLYGSEVGNASSKQKGSKRHFHEPSEGTGGSRRGVDVGSQSTNLQRRPSRSGLDPDADISLDSQRDGFPSVYDESHSRISPLVEFSSAATQAAARDPVNALQRKSTADVALEAERKRIWEIVLDRHPRDLDRSPGAESYGRVRAYRDLAKVPIPSSLRPRIWAKLLGVAEMHEKDPGLYGRLKASLEKEELSEDFEHTISADVTRTMPLHCLFWSGGAQVGVESLRSILRCYARYMPDVGYCQGMSSIAALLLMNSENEEDAFLMFVHFMANYGYRSMFLPGFPLYKEWLEELRPVVRVYMPELSSRLDNENILLELYADKWLITALTHNFPHRHLVRVWDLMLLGGSPKILLKACVAVLKLSESKLLGMNFDGIMNYLIRGFADGETGVLRADNVEEFLDLARGFRLVVPPEAQVASGSGATVPIAKQDGSTGAQNKSNTASAGETSSGGVFSSCFSCFGGKSKAD